MQLTCKRWRPSGPQNPSKKRASVRALHLGKPCTKKCTPNSRSLRKFQKSSKKPLRRAAARRQSTLKTKLLISPRHSLPLRRRSANRRHRAACQRHHRGIRTSLQRGLTRSRLATQPETARWIRELSRKKGLGPSIAGIVSTTPRRHPSVRKKRTWCLLAGTVFAAAAVLCSRATLRILRTCCTKGPSTVSSAQRKPGFDGHHRIRRPGITALVSDAFTEITSTCMSAKRTSVVWP
mmetsp:Transcript_5397/g.9930  ORF Transcript_5397/g.9930 Transcript_5397/m.9930 type:complete len:236 (+) Transcript_5397:395-1102(+)